MFCPYTTLGFFFLYPPGCTNLISKFMVLARQLNTTQSVARTCVGNSENGVQTLECKEIIAHLELKTTVLHTELDIFLLKSS